MNIENLVAVSALPGLHKIIANRDNGLIVEDIETGKSRFCSSRKHQFSPMETIAIFTDDDDSEKLENILQTMMDQVKSNPVPAAKASGADLKTYFEKILPTYDRDKVHVSHIKKVIKWYHLLDKKGFLTAEPSKKDDKKEDKADKKGTNPKKNAIKPQRSQSKPKNLAAMPKKVAAKQKKK